MRVVRSVCSTVLGSLAVILLCLLGKQVAHPETIAHPEAASLTTKAVILVLALASGFAAYSMFPKSHTSEIIRSVCGSILGLFALLCIYLIWKHVAHPETIEHPEAASLATRVVVDAALAFVSGFAAYS